MSIDIKTERLISLAQAARTLPPRRRGRPVHPATIYRWASRGLSGIVLETVQAGGSRVTTLDAMERFFCRLAEMRQHVLSDQAAPSDLS